ncbi:MAG: Dyp-type peroxidase [Gemmatimonadaceae bacterium]|nr:Dyp-type peroxidase [Gloeobacterales cyanobacterium ES-bin-141]
MTQPNEEVIGGEKDAPPPPPPTETPQLAFPPAGLIDLNNLEPTVKALLENLQGNILKGHGRDHVKLVFVKFTGAVQDIKKAIAEFANKPYLQSTLAQLEYVKRFNQYGIPGPLFANILLSASGYQAIGITDLGSFQEAVEDSQGLEVTVKFSDGAKSAKVLSELNDPPVQVWEQPYQEQLDGLVILADDDKDNLINVLNETIQHFKQVATIVTVESGDALRNAQKDSIEHFGYVDGRSQPLFFTSDLEKEIRELDGDDPTLNEEKPVTKFDPRAELDLVLVRDPFAPSKEHFGSYFVFRKLEQNVQGFKQQEQQLADALGLVNEQRELAGAYTVGRFEDGTPVVMRSSDGLNSPVPNNFNYADDPDGSKCPFSSHLRKMNPRGDIANIFGNPNVPDTDPLSIPKLNRDERNRRIARRGITYGERTIGPEGPLNDLPTKDVGLLFMCFQSSISKQFGFLQKRWANADRFVKPGTGIDPVIGQHPLAERPIAQKCPLEWGQPGSIRFGFDGFVTLKGSEFFFAPSLPFLQGLGS